MVRPHSVPRPTYASRMSSHIHSMNGSPSRTFVTSTRVCTSPPSAPSSTSQTSKNLAVFLTAYNFSAKALNRALLLIQDFEFGDYPKDSRWTLLTSKDDPPPEAPPATVLPVADISGANAFAGCSLTEINAFIRANEDYMAKMGVSAGSWLVIDQKGLETSTCLVCEQVYDSDAGKGGMTGAFRACRLPYERAWGMTVNLEIANMGFEDFVDEDAGEQDDGSWKWISFDADGGEDDGESEVEVKRGKALKELRDGGHAD
ncbi:hypothetical protein C8R46DRAFT_581351 [Mycena filopes]|nr:hypothetical protein C8R46DRAFT_581351 [Mycena filopes]